MSQVSINLPPRALTASGNRRVLLFFFATLGLGLAFFLAEHSLQPEALDSVEDGDQTVSRSRQLGIATVGLLGCILLVLKNGHRLILNTPLAKLIVALVVLCLASFLWTVDAPFTFRRSVAAILCFAGVLGICRQFRPIELCVMTLVVSCGFLSAGVLIELLGRGYMMEGGRYRFGGTVNPNLQSTYCAYISLAALCLQAQAKTNRLVLRGILVLGVAFLLLTGSRTGLYSLVAAVGALWWLSTSLRVKALMISVLPVLALVCVLVYEILVGETTSRLLEIVSMGRDVKTISTMTSRVPVWHEIFHFIGDRPLLGYGYQGFWGGDRLVEMSDRAGWGAASAHNAFLETILSVGLIGGLLHFMILTCGLSVAKNRLLQTGDAGFAFIFTILVFALVHSLAESAFAKPLFPCMILASGLAMLAFQPPPILAGMPMTNPLGRSRRLSHMETGESNIRFDLNDVPN